MLDRRKLGRGTSHIAMNLEPKLKGDLNFPDGPVVYCVLQLYGTHVMLGFYPRLHIRSWASLGHCRRVRWPDGPVVRRGAVIWCLVSPLWECFDRYSPLEVFLIEKHVKSTRDVTNRAIPTRILVTGVTGRVRPGLNLASQPRFKSESLVSRPTGVVAEMS
jgi:hypothetical protein